MKIYLSHSSNETKAIARSLAQKIKNTVVALTGDLGSGKTTFTQGFAEGLRIKDKIISPTFILIRQHPVPHSEKDLPAARLPAGQGRQVLYHIDLYRLSSKKELAQLGLKELLEDKRNIVLIEWAEKAKHLLPKNTLSIFFETINEKIRRITITN